MIVFFDYLLLRMQGQLNKFVLYVSPLILLYMLLSVQDSKQIIRTFKFFCIALLVSSFYGLLLRDTHQIQALRGNEVPAYSGSTAMRFQGLFQDPNYYMALIVLVIALLIKLYHTGHLKTAPFLATVSILSFFGMLTYSKTFFVVWVLLVVVFIVFHFYKKQYLKGIGIFLGFVGSILLLGAVTSRDGPISIILYRLASSTNLDSLTTGRSQIFVAYFNVLSDSLKNMLFGMGLHAEALERGTHNMFLEITYYTGIVGLTLYICYFCGLIHLLNHRAEQVCRQKFLAKYIVVIVTGILFSTLHGMFSAVSYVMLFLAINSTAIPLSTEESQDA